MVLWAVLTAGIALFNQCEMSDIKSIKELIDEFYPEIKERMAETKRNDKRNGK